MNNENFIVINQLPVLFWYEHLQRRRMYGCGTNAIAKLIDYKEYMMLELENNIIYLN